MRTLVTVLFTTITLYGTVELLDQLAPATSRIAAESSIGSVVGNARYDTLLNGTDWTQALAAVDAQLLDGEIVVEGTTVTHMDGYACWTAEVPTPTTPVQLEECEVLA